MEPQEEYQHKLEETEGRKKILSMKDDAVTLEFLRELEDNGVELVSKPSDCGDCLFWVITRLLLPLDYFFIGDREGVLKNEVNGVRLKSYASIGNIVCYAKEAYSKVYEHVGVCVGYRDNKPLIESRWGAGGPVVRHPLEIVPEIYGTHVEYLEII